MPKIIENAREQLLNEARQQLIENGYSAVTIRSVAGACGLGIGTVYNYFKSKDILIASFMLEDWNATLLEMKAERELEGIYRLLKKFIDEHRYIFTDEAAVKVFLSGGAGKHKLLRAQIARVILPMCQSSECENQEFLSEFIAESLLTWTVAGKSFEEINLVLNLLFK